MRTKVIALLAAVYLLCAPESVASARTVAPECAGLTSTHLLLCAEAVRVPAVAYDVQGVTVHVPAGPVLTVECRAAYEGTELTDCLAEVAKGTPGATPEGE